MRARGCLLSIVFDGVLIDSCSNIILLEREFIVSLLQAITKVCLHSSIANLLIVD